MLRTYGVSLFLAAVGLASCLFIRGYKDAIPASYPQPEPLPVTTPQELFAPAKPTDEKTKAEHINKLYSDLGAGKFKIVSATRALDKNNVRRLVVDGKMALPTLDAEMKLLAETIDRYLNGQSVVVFYWEQDISFAAGPDQDREYRQHIFDVAASRRQIAVDNNAGGTSMLFNVLDFRYGRPAVPDSWDSHEQRACFDALMKSYDDSMAAYHSAKEIQPVGE